MFLDWLQNLDLIIFIIDNYNPLKLMKLILPIKR